MDSFFNTPDIYAAFDGGGTKTEALCIHSDGTILKRLLLGGSNPNSVGLEACAQVFRDALMAFQQEGFMPSHVFIGCAGMGTASNRDYAMRALRRDFPSISLEIKPDTCNALYSIPHDEAIAVICGTGSVVYARDASGEHRMGGWGYLFGDEFSGYHLGRDAIRAVYAEYDGLTGATLLRPLLEAKMGGNIWECINTFFREGRSLIASLAPLVFEAYQQGDSAAETILAQNAASLSELIRAAAHTYACGNDVWFFGGISRQKTILQHFLAPLLPGMQLHFPEMPPVYGACIGAVRPNKTNQESFRANFARCYQQLSAEG